MAENIKIAVRVRPFAKHEKGQDNIIAMEGSTVTIIDPSGQEEPKDYAFDKCFWSHDGEGRKLEANVDVYEDVGKELLNNAFTGFNATIFAYGQTGSGKSYSIEGCPEDIGILQRICENIFERKNEIESTEGN